MSNDVWTTKDGTQIKVCDMTDQHLFNTIRMLKRNARYKVTSTLEFYCCTSGPRGDMAQLAFESELSQWMEADWSDVVPEIFWLMVEELRGRLDLFFRDDLEEVLDGRLQPTDD